MTKQEDKLIHLQVGLNEIKNGNQVNTLNTMNDEFENQKRAYDNYLKLFYPELLRTKTIYLDLFNILDRDLDLTKVSLGDYFLAQFVSEVNKSLDRIEDEVNKYTQYHNFDKIQKEQLLYHKSYLINCINGLMNKNSSTTKLKEKHLFPAEKANEDANNFFNYLVKNYHTKKRNTAVKYFNILQYLRNYAPKEKYTFKITNKEYEPIIEESFGIKITNWNESENFKEKIIPELNGHESKFCSNKC